MIDHVSDQQDVRLEPYRDIRDRDLAGRGGLFVAEGKIVLSILAGRSEYALMSVLILESKLEANAALLSQLPEATPVLAVSAQIMDSVAGFHVHRGLLGIGRRIGQPTVEEFIGNASADSLLTVLSDISNHDNVGSIFRNAAAFSADGVILDSKCCDPLYRKALRVSVGGVLTVPWAKGGDISAIITELIAGGYAIAVLSPSGRRPIRELPSKGRRALLLGSEGHGLPPALMAKLDTYRIPMSSTFDSLNVATASGIALYAASRFGQTE